jgi:hypothetical protein
VLLAAGAVLPAGSCVRPIEKQPVGIYSVCDQ